MAIADVNAPRAREAAEALGPSAVAVEMDVTRQDSIDAGVAAAVEALGGIDILVNNAALFTAAPIVEIERADYDRVFAVNVAGTLFTLQAVARHMIERGQGGRIINMASQAGRRGEPLVAVYCATKAAVISLTQSAGLDLIRHGINVNAIAPGVVEGEHWDGVDAFFAKHEGKAPGPEEEGGGRGRPLRPHGQGRGPDRHGDLPRHRRGPLHRRPDLQRGWWPMDELMPASRGHASPTCPRACAGRATTARRSRRASSISGWATSTAPTRPGISTG